MSKDRQTSALGASLQRFGNRRCKFWQKPKKKKKKKNLKTEKM